MPGWCWELSLSVEIGPYSEPVLSYDTTTAHKAFGVVRARHRRYLHRFVFTDSMNEFIVADVDANMSDSTWPLVVAEENKIAWREGMTPHGMSSSPNELRVRSAWKR